MPDPLLIFDGHNDTLTRIRSVEGRDLRAFLDGRTEGHIDLSRARAGGLVGGFFAIFTRSPGWSKKLAPLVGPEGEVVEGGFSVAPPGRLSRATALRHVVQITSGLLRLEAESGGALEIVRTAADVRRCRAEGRLAVILHIEGAECLDTRLEALDVLVAAGLRSLGLVWSRSNAFGHGVPFDFPRSPDTGPGLTAAGRRLVRRCNGLGVLVDLSHLNEAGFWEVAEISTAPLVATHSCAYALSPSPRNLTDRQLDAVAESGGVVGINFHKGFLRADGDWTAPTSVSEIARHARYVADHIGVEHVALGSDFDGATMPDDLPDASALPALVSALRTSGFDDRELDLIGHGNWDRVLEQTWKP
jgi:membrane dipeptidase